MSLRTQTQEVLDNPITRFSLEVGKSQSDLRWERGGKTDLANATNPVIHFSG